MDHLRLQSAFKFVAISTFGDGSQLMTAANLCLEAVDLSTVSIKIPQNDKYPVYESFTTMTTTSQITAFLRSRTGAILKQKNVTIFG